MDNWERAGNPPRTLSNAVVAWLYRQSGRCVAPERRGATEPCGTMAELQANHIVPLEEAGREADRLDNLNLPRRRHNVAQRKTHKNAAKTGLSTAPALMFLLLTRRPTTTRGSFG
jgi:hypothetical protein